jgi:hypothetical protein
MNEFNMDEILNINRAIPSLVGRFFRWLFRRRIMRRVLPCVAGLITLITTYCVSANWHLQRALARCKQQMAAKGEVLDWFACIPPAVPDDQNMFKAPKISEWFASSFPGPPFTNEFARSLLGGPATSEITSAAAAVSYLTWSDQFQSDFDALGAAMKRPCARMDGDDSPAVVPVPNKVTALTLAGTLARRAKSHLLLGQTDKAWQEWTLLHGFKALLEGRPASRHILAQTAAVSREVAVYSMNVIAKGLELHAWQEPQLRALQSQLEESDFLSPQADALRSLRMFYCWAYEEVAQDGLLGVLRVQRPWSVRLFGSIAPRAFIYKIEMGWIEEIQNFVDALSFTDGPIRPHELSAKLLLKQSRAGWQRIGPAVLRTQTLSNEAQIACALERYRLARGDYPAELGALVPQFIEKLPRDLINGQPLIYRRTEDGSFLLYSVGWNETDDGGKIMAPNGDPKQLTSGDWVWKNSISEF